MKMHFPIKDSKSIKKTVFVLVMILGTCSIFTSVYFIKKALDRSEARTVQEHEERLQDIAYGIDHALTEELQQLRLELIELVESPDLMEAESLALSGDTSAMQDILRKELYVREKCLEYALFMQGEDILACAGAQELHSMQIFEDHKDKEIDLIVCRGDNAEYCVGIRVPSSKENCCYCILFNAGTIFDTIVADQYWDRTWVVLYDIGSGLAIQNHENQPTALVFSREEIKERQDGYTFILEAELQGEIVNTVYEYSNPDGVIGQQYLVAMPSGKNGNGRLSIGVAMDSRELFHSINTVHKEIYKQITILILGVVLLLAGLGRLVYLDRQNKAELRNIQVQGELNAQLMEARMKNSMAQLQPHFLYNSLASIREIVLEDPQYGSDLLYDFTKHLRACIRAASDGGIVPFTQEIENIKAYVDIEKMRFEDRFDFQTDLAVTDFDIVPLTIQPLVENAIRHGICEERGRTGYIRLSTSRQEQEVLILIEDNGRGFDYNKWAQEAEEMPGTSVGLRNAILSLRMKLNARVDIDSRIGEGTRISIHIPCQLNTID